MRKFILAAFVYLSCCLCVEAYSPVEFLGLPIETTTKAEFAEALIQKGYKYYNEADGYVMYVGQFLGLDASIMLVPNSSNGVTALVVSMDDLNPVKMGQTFSSLTQKYMSRYADYKYTTEASADGGTQIMFIKRKDNGLTDFISIENKIEGGSCSIQITHACNISFNDDTTSDGGGISMDDI